MSHELYELQEKEKIAMSNLSAFSGFSLLPAHRVFNEFDSVLDSFLNDRQSASRPLISKPRVNIEETSEGYSIHMAAPGLCRDDFKIESSGGYITISTNQKKENQEKINFLTHEYSYSSFSRSWKIPSNINLDGITARYNAGILTLSLPVISKNSHKVEIRVD